MRMCTTYAYWRLIFLIGMSMQIAVAVSAQLSPGDLTSAHAHLEGIANCTKCHVLGDKVTNDKCLECHTEIKSRMASRKGYHASSEVVGKDCFACHSEHHGRGFEIVRFDEEKFNHQLTGYKLTGAHLEADCKACHNRDLIASIDLKKKNTTYLGLRTDCVACHADVHQKTLGTNCASCHTTEHFAPATLFDHQKTDFPLKGKHRNVDCKSCHLETEVGGEPFQRFAGVPFESCADCHEDVHNNQFGRDCKQCHTEESFLVLSGKSSFNHNQTRFPLSGQHRNVNCASCHQMGETVDASEVFQDYKGKDIHQCQTCHQDVHENKFGQDCRQCHSEESFRKLRNADKFEHSLTGYPLEGKHRQVDCRECHESRMIEPVPHDRCMDCHDDFHKGQLVRDNYRPDCKECHTTDGFKDSHYTIEKHNNSNFPLTGAHLATPCVSCHLEKEEWSFRNIGSHCIDCHRDPHAGYLSESYYPDKACDNCHSTESWTTVQFDHQQTGFELAGRHEQITCTACHQPDTTTSIEIRLPFAGLESSCISCHENIHGSQFEIELVTDCTRCHGFEAWKPTSFDHNTARFILDGAHQNLACSKCHLPEVDDAGNSMVIYKLEKLECIDCHL